MTENYLALWCSSSALISSIISLTISCCHGPDTTVHAQVDRNGFAPLSQSELADEQNGSLNNRRKAHLLYPRTQTFWKQIFFSVSSVSMLARAVIFQIKVDEGLSLGENSYQAAWILIPCAQVVLATTAGIFFDNLARKSNSLLFFWIMCYIFVLFYSLLAWLCGSWSDFSICSIDGSEKFLLVLSNIFTSAGLILFLLNTTASPIILPVAPTKEFVQGLLAHISFSHMNETINLGRVKPSFDIPDVPLLYHTDQCKVIFDRVGYEELEKNPASLTQRMLRVLGKNYLQQAFFQFGGILCSYIAPLSLRRVLEHVSSTDPDSPPIVSATGVLGILSSVSPWVAVFLIFLGPALKCICDGQNYMVGRRMAVNTRSLLISVIYRRSLRVDLSAVDEGSGTLNNLMSVDVREIGEWVAYSGFLWATVVEMIITLSLLYQVMGTSCVVGVMIMMLTVPLAGGSSKYMNNYQTDMLKTKDERMSIIGEILSGIRIIKWFTWEDNFKKKISAIRGNELKTLRSYMFCNAFLQTCYGTMPTMVGVTTFLVHTQVFHRPLSPATGFTAILLFNSLRRPMEILPDMINFTIRCRVSYLRVLKFFGASAVTGLPAIQALEQQSHPRRQSSPAAILVENPIVLSLENVTLAWNAARPQGAEDSKADAPNSGFCCRSRSKSIGDNEYMSCSRSISACVERTKSFFVNGDNSYARVAADSQQSPAHLGDIELTVQDDEESLVSHSHHSAEHKKHKEIIILREVNMQVKQGDLVAIVGSTGSGKSTLVAGILGECKRKAGKLLYHGAFTISYVSQSSWIQNATVRDNILFGLPYEEERYNAVLYACALEADLLQFPDGDQTDIGEKGVNLSGGQQQRVSLARAAYSRSDIIILDDPLSAVDAHVGDHIFRELVCKYLVGRTRLLVTHQIAMVIPMADKVLCLDGTGGVAAYTSPVQLADSLITFSLKENSKSIGRSVEAQNPLLTTNNSTSNNGNMVGSKSSANGFFDLIINISKEIEQRKLDGAPVVSMRVSTPSAIASTSNKSTSGKSSGSENTVKLVEKEEKGTGSIGWPVYWFYLSAGGGALTVFAILAADIMVPISWFTQNYSLSHWLQSLETELPLSVQRSCLLKYLLAATFVLICTVCKQLLQMVATLRASEQLHERMLVSVLGATVTWHDSQPSGRKTNRFSQDIYEVDNSVMIHMQEFFDCLFGTLQVVLVIITMVPIMIPCLLPVLVYDYVVASKFVIASRELKRLESVTKSPVFVLFSETMSGISVVRALRQENRFFELCCNRVDIMCRCHLYMWACSRWLNFRTQFMSAAVSGLVAFMVVHQARVIGSSVAGLTLVYALSFTDNVTFLARMHSECQMSLNSVERIMEYLGVEQERYQSLSDPEDALGRSTSEALSPMQGSSLSREEIVVDDEEDSADEVVKFEVAQIAMKRRPSWEGPASPLSSSSASWPSQGSIHFDNISMRYRPMTPLVLKGISFRIEAGLKVGVCGRSGAGKSSLLTALFRTVEPEAGHLWIDGVNVLTIPLKQLRKNLSIVPQDPILFQGTIKSNLDPFDESNDTFIWEALKKVHMSGHVAAMAGGTGREFGSLDDKIVAEKGSNFSVGQRQLLCMARAIIRRAKILILDEATASVDAETDALIQETVRNQFNGVTVLSIAHRLNTIAFYDKVMVISDGGVAEFDSPYALLQDSKTIFRGMCERSGDFESIFTIAKAAESGRSKFQNDSLMI